MALVKWGFRRFYSSRQALSEISKLVAGSHVQQSESSSAASVTSKKPVRGKVAIAARKKMLQSFVDKYRAMNQGKFPSPSSAQKEIGGGYYSLKKMLQEMEYNDKVSSVEKESAVENKSESITKEIAIESSFEDRVLESVSNSDTNFDFKEGLQPSTSNADTGNINVTRDDTLDIVTECHDRQSQFHEKLEQNLKDESLLGEAGAEFMSDMPGPQKEVSKAESQHEIPTIKSDIPERQEEELKAEQNHDKIQNDMPEQQDFEVLEAEKHRHEIQCITSDMPNQQKDESKPEKHSDETQNIVSDLPKQQTDEEIREKLSLWGNLKMLATGLINIWKK